jgi:hypothetical protein
MATYYVTTTGNDTNDGTAIDAAHAWRTIQHAADTMIAGDTVNISAGAYGELVTMSTSGTEANPITFTGPVTATTTRFVTSGADWIVVDGLGFGPGAGGVYGSVHLDGDHSTLKNFLIDNLTTDGRIGVWVDGDYNTISDGEIKNMFATCIYVNSGNHNLVTRNLIHDLRSCDVFRCWGTYNTFSYNETHTAIYYVIEEHPDCFQVFSFDATTVANNIVFDGNYWHDMDMQAFYMSNSHASPDIHDITFRNNIWANITMQGQVVATPNMKFHNNLFYKVGQGTYDGMAIDIQSGSTTPEVINNIFLECGNDTSDPVKGWYTMAESGTKLNSYVGGASFAAKTITETGVVNGGDPKFRNLSGLDFHLLTGSPLIDVGDTIASFATDKDSIARPQDAAWDIGPYEYFANPWVMIYG